MFNAARRGPASIARAAHPSFISVPRCASIFYRPLGGDASRIDRTSQLLRRYSVSQLKRQQSARAEAIENAPADKVSTQRSPSDPRAGQHGQGPVTRFEELGERGLVCRTIVKTLTQDMGLETMTKVQSLTINETLKGGDV